MEAQFLRQHSKHNIYQQKKKELLFWNCTRLFRLHPLLQDYPILVKNSIECISKAEETIWTARTSFAIY